MALSALAVAGMPYMVHFVDPSSHSSGLSPDRALGRSLGSLGHDMADLIMLSSGLSKEGFVMDVTVGDFTSIFSVGVIEPSNASTRPNWPAGVMVTRCSPTPPVLG